MTKKKKDDTEEINDIPAIDHPPADTAVMEIDTEHLDIVISP